MTNISFTSSTGAKTYIGEADLNIAYRDLLAAGFSMVDAKDKSLDLCIGRAEASLIPIEDQIYGKSLYREQLHLLATINSKLGTNDYELSTPHSK